MISPKTIASIVMCLACLAFGKLLPAETTQTWGSGSAVVAIDRFDNFDLLDFFGTGTNLETYQSSGPSVGLSVTTIGRSFYGDNEWGYMFVQGAYFNPFHLIGPNPVGESYRPVGGGFYVPEEGGSIGNTDWVTIATTDAQKIYGVEFLYGNAWSTGQVPYRWGSNAGALEWKTLIGGSLVSSGSVFPVMVGTVLGFSDPAGFDELLVRSTFPGNPTDPNLQELALDNLVVQLTPVPEPSSLLMLLGGLLAAGLFFRRLRA